MFFHDGIFSKLIHTLKVCYLRSGMYSHMRFCGGSRPMHPLRGMSGLVVFIRPGAMLISVTFVTKDHAQTHGLGSLLNPWWCSWVVLTWLGPSPANAQWYRQWHGHGRVGPPSLANSCMVLHSWYLLVECRPHGGLSSSSLTILQWVHGKYKTNLFSLVGEQLQKRGQTWE